MNRKLNFDNFLTRKLLDYFPLARGYSLYGYSLYMTVGDAPPERDTFFWGKGLLKGQIFHEKENLPVRYFKTSLKVFWSLKRGNKRQLSILLF